MIFKNNIKKNTNSNIFKDFENKIFLKFFKNYMS